MHIYLLIVIYNRDCRELFAALSILRFRDATVVIYDNGTETWNNAAVCAENSVVYLGGKGNQGLSVAYNQTAEWCLNQGREGYLCLFDDDAEIPEAYLAALKQASAKARDIYVPLLYAGDTLLSPAILKANFHCAFFPSAEAAKAYQGEDLTALNSGMAIPLEIFQSYRYDERLFLDGIDHRFVKDMKEQGKTIGFLPVELKHGLSAMERPSLDSALHRFVILNHDVRIFAGKRWRWVLWRRLLKLTAQYRTLAFFKVCLKRGSV